MSDVATISVGLLSHTNAGKTTLARTLLRRDIGAVDDRAHVTEVAERHVLIESPQADVLALWDTPGFGDSVRLYSRLTQNQNPVAWLLTQVWDRLVDRAFWSGQQAIRNAREQCDVVLYLINAAEQPDEAPYIDVEMRILAWIGKPVLLVLNQLGSPPAAEQASADMTLWRTHLAEHACVRGVLSLDAFGRCWVQEDLLLAQITDVLAPELHPAAERLRAAWHVRNFEIFERSMQVIARQLACVAVDESELAEPNVPQRIRGWVSYIASGGDHVDAELARAEGALRTRLNTAARTGLDELIRLHGLSGRAAAEQLHALVHELAVERPADEHKASLLGGLLSGAAGGLAADLAAGGLTFGAGALLGGIVGAFGAHSAAQIYNIVSGRESGRVRWSQEFMTERVVAAVLAYLAVAHFGRGRGEFVRSAAPEHWQQAVGTLMLQREALDAIWETARVGELERTERELLPVLTALTREVLTALYPDASRATLPWTPVVQNTAPEI